MGVRVARISSLQVRQNTLPQVGLVRDTTPAGVGPEWQTGDRNSSLLPLFSFSLFFFFLSLAFVTYLKPPILFN